LINQQANRILQSSQLILHRTALQKAWEDLERTHRAHVIEYQRQLTEATHLQQWDKISNIVTNIKNLESENQAHRALLDSSLKNNTEQCQAKREKLSSYAASSKKLTELGLMKQEAEILALLQRRVALCDEMTTRSRSLLSNAQKTLKTQRLPQKTLSDLQKVTMPDLLKDQEGRGSTEQIISQRGKPKISSQSQLLPTRPSGEKQIFTYHFPVTEIRFANPWGVNNCLIDSLLQLLQYKGDNRQEECARLRQLFVDSTQGLSELIQHGEEIPLSLSPRIICAYHGCKNVHFHRKFRIIGHSTLNGKLAFPEMYETQDLESSSAQELHLWNTGDHFEPIFNMPVDWEQRSVYQALFANPTGTTIQQANPISQLSRDRDTSSSASTMFERLLDRSPANTTASTYQKAVEELLLHVVRGEQSEAEKMIVNNPDILLHKGQVTDYSNRTFKNITAFQYALWALDWHMWRMIKKYLPDKTAGEQLNELENRGTDYGVHYDFNELLNALNTYIEKRTDVHWNTLVGGAQTQVPAHVANEYCRRDLSFSKQPNPYAHLPLNTFTEEIALPRIFGLEKGEWFPLTKSIRGFLGKDFGVLRYNFRYAYGLGGSFRHGQAASGSGEREDFLAIQKLFEVRLSQYKKLRESLTQVPSVNITPAKVIPWRPRLTCSDNDWGDDGW